MLAWVGLCRCSLRIVGLIQSSSGVILLASAAFREVAAAEWFRRDFEQSRDLPDGHRLQVATNKDLCIAGGVSTLCIYSFGVS